MPFFRTEFSCNAEPFNHFTSEYAENLFISIPGIVGDFVGVQDY